MRRQVVTAAGVVALAVMATAAVGLARGGRSRPASPEAVTTPTTPSTSPPPASPTSPASPFPSVAATSPSPTASSGAEVGRAVARSAQEVDCSRPDDQKFCSVRNGMRVRSGTYETYAIDDRPAYGASDLTVAIVSTVRKPDGSPANPGDAVGSIHVVVTVENDTSQTFSFPGRVIVLDVFREGERIDELATNGPGFDMTPRGRMTGTFDYPITRDGTYTWQARTWYQPK